MADKIKLEYPKAEEMQKTFKAAGSQLEATITEMKNISKTLQDGALLGSGGAAYVEAVSTKLLPSLDKLRKKYDELDKDVKKAVDLMKQQDAQTKTTFR